MPDDVVLGKVEIIERCLRRIRQEYGGTPTNLHENLTRQDSIVLNLERACQASIDLALRLIKLRQLGLPKESREAFGILETNGLLPPGLSQSLQAMVGFRNIAIHNYRQLDLRVVENILKERLDDFRAFAELAIKLP
jgi:uncharacterized protein YutE (UPF0331/DUF86 family)